MQTRRTWLLGSMAGLALSRATAVTADDSLDAKSWQMGLIADLHYGLAPDAASRLDKFMEDVSQKKPDCLLQLGDFNFGVDSAACMTCWSQFTGPKYHVLGNHDMDKVSKQHMVEYWKIPKRYYSFDHKGWHFVVLDRNNLKVGKDEFVSYNQANFYVDSKQRGFADPEQLEWLTADLEQTDMPTVVFAHQGLGMAGGKNKSSAAATQIEQVLRSANQKRRKVHACFCGHHHIDRYNARDGIHYLWINSASYYWVGAKYGRMAPYKDPLFTYLTFHQNGDIEVAPSMTTWDEPSPKKRGFPEWESLNTVIRARVLGRT